MLLAHESGHAVQAMMMSRAGVPQLIGRGPAWMTESFGRFNEFLVADFLARTNDPTKKPVFESELLRRAFVLFGAATEGAVELAIHDAIAKGGNLAPEALSDVTRSTGSRFSDRFQQPFDNLLWTRVETYYADPLHATSSMISSLLALVLYKRFSDSPERFIPAYVALLRNGYDAPSATLLRRFLSIDLASDAFVAEALSELRALVNRRRTGQ
jgi:oligoendopeptidase F